MLRGSARRKAGHRISQPSRWSSLNHFWLRLLEANKTIRSQSPTAPICVRITRERPKIDRIACPWLIRRFIDPEAKFLFAPTERVFAVAAETGATAYGIPGAAPAMRGACPVTRLQVRFARDSALEGGVTSEPVSEAGLLAAGE